VILAATVAHMKSVLETFTSDFPEFSTENITVVGHSLGSVILFDLLTTAGLAPAHVIPFVPRNFISLGSPTGFIFGTTEKDPAWLNARLSRMRIHDEGLFRNAFHPSDPIAYRLEPLLARCFHAGKSLSSDDCDNLVEWFPNPVPIEDLLGPAVALDKAATGNALTDAAALKQEEPSLAADAQQLALCEECFSGRIPQWPLNGAPSLSSRKAALDRRIDVVLKAPARSRMTEYFSALRAHTSYYSEPTVVSLVMATIAHGSVVRRVSGGEGGDCDGTPSPPPPPPPLTPQKPHTPPSPDKCHHGLESARGDADEAIRMVQFALSPQPQPIPEAEPVEIGRRAEAAAPDVNARVKSTDVRLGAIEGDYPSGNDGDAEDGAGETPDLGAELPFAGSDDDSGAATAAAAAESTGIAAAGDECAGNKGGAEGSADADAGALNTRPFDVAVGVARENSGKKSKKSTKKK